MKPINIVCAAILILTALASCDSGDIVEREPELEHTGLTAVLEGTLTGMQQWPETYDIALAAYAKDNVYSLVQKHVQTDGDGKVRLELANISPDAATIELCVTDRLRERVLTFERIEVTEAMRRDTDTPIRLDVGQLDVGMFSAIRREVFEERGECTRCHGTPERAAAGMSLLADYAYDHLVGHAAKVDPTQTRVLPGDAEGSWLVRVLTPGNGSLTRYKDHPNILNNEQDKGYIDLIRAWINTGAQR